VCYTPRGATDDEHRRGEKVKSEPQFVLLRIDAAEWHRALGQTHAEEASDAQANARAKIRARA